MTLCPSAVDRPGSSCSCDGPTCAGSATQRRRGQYGYRLITGACTSSLWRMTFGYTAPIQWDTGSRAGAWSASGKLRN